MPNPTLPTLPEESARTLIALREDNPEEFYAYIYALKDSGWSLRAISEPLGVSRTAVSGWVKKHSHEKATPPKVPSPPAPEKAVKATRHREEGYTLSDSQSQQLHNLTQEASAVRRFTDSNARSRKAAQELEDLLRGYIKLGVSKKRLSEHCGVSDSAIKQRLRKAH